MVVPPKQPKMIISSRQNPWFLGKPTIFKKPPPYTRCFRIPPILGGTNEKCCYSQLDQPTGQRRYWSSPSCFWHRVSSICQDRRLHAPVSTTLLLRSVGDAHLVVGHLVGKRKRLFFVYLLLKLKLLGFHLCFSYIHLIIIVRHLLFVLLHLSHCMFVGAGLIFVRFFFRP